MSDLEQLVPAHVRALAEYPPGKPLKQAERESGLPCIKLASNENPFGPSPLARAAMQEALLEANFYPDDYAGELRFMLAERHRIHADQILVTAGSTSFLTILAHTVLSPGLNAVTSALSFIQYPIVTRAAGGTLIETPLRNHGFDLEAILAAINPQTRVVYLANPNNPTGTLFDAATLDRFLDRVPSHVLVVIDEAYYEFAQYFASHRGVNYSHSLDYIRQGRRAVVLRTFSKAQGLAGMRIGYGMGPAELISYFARLRTTFSVSAAAQAGAAAALRDEAHVLRAVENNAREAPKLEAALAALGCRIVPTWGNFVFCELGEDASAMARRLQDRGVIIRSLKPWGAPTAIRVTIGTPEQNEKFLAAFRQERK
jgi:histidinol-phosphate aminotransferase